MEDRSIRKRRLTDEAGLPVQVVSPGATATNSAGGGRVVSPSPKKRQFTGSENSSPRHTTNHTSKEDAEPMTAAEVSRNCLPLLFFGLTCSFVATRFCYFLYFSRHFLFFFGIFARFGWMRCSLSLLNMKHGPLPTCPIILPLVWFFLVFWSRLSDDGTMHVGI